MKKDDKYWLERDRFVTNGIPEYNKFRTGKINYDAKAKVVNIPGCPEVDHPREFKEGKLGDFIDSYIQLVLLKKEYKTFWGRIKKVLSIDYRMKEVGVDSAIRDMRSALSYYSVEWW